jgi:hypothetical protein
VGVGVRGEQVRILGIDPGGTTGLSVLEDGVYQRSWGLSLPEIYEACGDTLSDLGAVMRHVDAVVIEDFVLYAWKHQEMGFDRLPAVRSIGALLVLTTLLEIEPVWQLAGVVKPVLPNSVLNKHIVIPKGLSAHEKDATRHALYYHLKETHGKKR